MAYEDGDEVEDEEDDEYINIVNDEEEDGDDLDQEFVDDHEPQYEEEEYEEEEDEDEDEDEEEYDEEAMTAPNGGVMKQRALESLTDGCFYIEYQPSRARDRSQGERGGVEEEVDHFQRLLDGREPRNMARWRKLASERCIDVVQEHIDKLRTNLLEKSVNNIINFVKNDFQHALRDAENEVNLLHSILQEKEGEGKEKGDEKDSERVLENILNDSLSFEAIEMRSSTKNVSIIAETISTAVIFAGMNVQDHEDSFEQLAKRLEKDVKGVRVAVLQSKTCGQTLRTLKTELMSHSLPPRLSKVANKWDVQRLAQWYRQQRMKLAFRRRDANEANNKERGDEGYQHLVVMLSDFDFFPAGLVQDIVSILSTHQSDLRLTLIFGIATNSVIGESVPRWTTSLLRIERFSMNISWDLLASFIDDIVIRGAAETRDSRTEGDEESEDEEEGEEVEGGLLPVRLGPQALEFLVENFRHNDYSCKTLTRIYKFIIIEHYYTNPLSVLNCGRDQYNAYNITERHLQRVRRLPSFKRFVNDDQLPPNVRRSMMNDDDALREFINESMSIFEVCHRRYPAAFSCYIILLQLVLNLRGGASKLASTSSSSSFSSSSTSTSSSSSSSAAQRQFRRIEYQKILAEDDFERRLTELEKELEHTASRSLIEELLKRWRTILPAETLRVLFPHFGPGIDTLLKAAKEGDFFEEHKATLRTNLYFRDDRDFEAEGSQSSNEGKKTTKTTNYAAPSKRLQRKQALQEARAAHLQDRNDTVKLKMIRFIVEFLRLHIRSPYKLPLSEVFYFNNVQKLENVFNPSCREVLNRALMDPQSYLDCDCCSIDERPISYTMPDTCIVFKLMDRGGRMVNLYDIYTAFRGICSSEKTTTEKQLQARFLMAIKELRYLGLVKETSRKQDHIIRIVHTLAV